MFCVSSPLERRTVLLSLIKESASMAGLLLIIVSFFLKQMPMAQASNSCFDVSERVQNRIPLLKPLSAAPPATLPTASVSGEKSPHLFWAAASTNLPRSLASLFAALVSHQPTKSSQASKVDIQVKVDSKNDLHDQTSFVVRPFPLIKVEWTEDWFFNHLSPTVALISFEKTSGTEHIAHLCGQIELTAQSEQSTKVQVYQEVQADRHSEKDTLDGVLSILSKLRAGA
jgi:hypothetical protein